MVRSWFDRIEHFMDQDNLHTVNLWNYVTALRGSDDGKSLVKFVLTSPLRGNTLHGYGIDQAQDELNDLDKNAFIEGLLIESDHYLWHIEVGYNAIGEYLIGRDVRRTRDALKKHHSTIRRQKELALTEFGCDTEKNLRIVVSELVRDIKIFVDKEMSR